MRSGNRLLLKLRPLEDGRGTQLSLCGPLWTELSPRELRRLLSMLAFWSGSPVSVVLFVDGQGEWCERWGDALAAVPGRHLEVEFRLGPGDSSGAGG